MDSDENRYMARGWMIASKILQRGGDEPNAELDAPAASGSLNHWAEDGAFYAEQYAPALKNLRPVVGR
ncbi:MAG: hypothetical protein U5O39_12930 [Gammaproteobacteria bacterium]|nr:hypothetical protein [Gammaproteobacteria bacterium]